MNVLLELFDSANDVAYLNPDTVEWVLTIDGKPYPCESKCVMNYETALKMIALAETIEGTTDVD
jgi:hypothetical protein